MTATASLTLRSVETGDAEFLPALFAELGYPGSPEDVASRLNRLINDETYGAWVCLDGDDIVGFAAGHFVFPLAGRDEAVQLIALVSAPSARGRGVGKALMSEFENWAVGLGATQAVVTSGSQRGAAHAFYARQGFHETGLRFSKDLNA